MAAKPPAAVSIPRFLLPQLTWRAPHLRPASTLPSTSSSRRRHGTSAGRRERHQQQRVQFHTSAGAAAAGGREAASSRAAVAAAADWVSLSRMAKQQLLQGDGQVKLTRSLYRALRSSFQPASKTVAGTGTALSAAPSPLMASVSLLPRSMAAAATIPIGSSSSVLQTRGFRTSRVLARDHHFDTLKFVQRLKDEGFSEAQAAAMMRVLSDVIEESIQNLTRTMVLREDAERATYTQKVDFTKLRSELLSTDNAEAGLTRASHERLANDLAKINSRLRDDIGRTQASVRLDLNLEKGRIREEANVQELKIKETEARIEQEVAGLRERVEGVKFGTLQWLMGVCTGTAAIILGAWRLLM